MAANVSSVPSVPTIRESDLRLLGIFRAVVEAGGLTAAAAKLGMERSTISRHLQALETRLGSVLCLRGPSGFELTVFGMRALRAALVAQDALHRVQDELERSLSVITGEIHLGLADNCLTNSDSRVAEVISHFQDVAPAVRLHVSIRPPLDLLDDIRSRRLNFAVMALPKGETGFEEAPLFDEEFRLYVGADAPDDLNLDNLSRRGFGVVAREGNLQSEALASQAGCELRAKARGLEAVATLLASGRFVGFLPQHLVNALLSTFHFRGVPGSEHLSYRKTFSLVREELRTPSAAGDLFSKLVIETHQSVTLG